MISVRVSALVPAWPATSVLICLVVWVQPPVGLVRQSAVLVAASPRGPILEPASQVTLVLRPVGSAARLAVWPEI